MSSLSIIFIASILGGQTCEGHPVLHLPDTGTFCQIPDDHLRRLLRYLAGVPLPHEQNAGFVIVVDRRRDKWSSVKTVLLKISVRVVYYGN